jgi:hypothetical protein
MLLSVLIASVLGLYREQAGQEISKQFIGNVVALHAISAREVIVLTDSYLAGLRDDKVQWRRSLSDNRHLICEDHCITIGDQVRSWSFSGSLQWELNKNASSAGIHDRKVFLAGKELFQVDGSDGSILKSWKWSDAGVAAAVGQFVFRGEDVYFKTASSVFRLHQGEISKQATPGALVVTEHGIYTVSTQTIHNIETKDDKPISLVGKVLQAGGDLFLLQTDQHTTVYRIGDSLKPEMIHKFVRNREFKEFYTFRQVSGHEQAIILVERTEVHLRVEAAVISSEKSVISDTKEFSFANWGDLVKVSLRNKRRDDLSGFIRTLFTHLCPEMTSPTDLLIALRADSFHRFGQY